MRLTDLQTFLLVVRDGSMAEAARELGVPNSTVSRRVSRLEDDLGTALLERDGRSARVTDAGELIATRCGPALRQLEEVEQLLAASEPRGVLKLCVAPSDAAAPVFSRFLLDYRAICPEVDVEVHMSERNVDLVEEGFDIAIRPGGPQVGSPGLMRRLLGKSRMGFFASPEFLARVPPPPSPDLLSGDAVIVQRSLMATSKGRGHSGRLWKALTGLPARCRIDDFTVIVRMAVQGGGIALMPSYVAQPHLESGTLRQLWPEVEMPRGYLHLLWPQSRHLALRVRRFIDLAVKVLAPDGELVWR
ncbi:MAG: LysR family transcriptional regulator [Myxococcota bacterium]